MNNYEIAQELGVDVESIDSLHDEFLKKQLADKLSKWNENSKAEKVQALSGDSNENVGTPNSNEVLNMMNNKDTHIAELTTQLSNTSSSLHDQIDKCNKLELKFSEFKKNNSILDKDFEIEDLKIKVNKLQKSDELKQAELDQLQKQYSEYRLNKNNESSDSDHKLMLMEAEIRSTKEQNTFLVENLSKANKDLKETLCNLSKVKDEHNFDKQHFIQEMDMKQRIIESLEQNLQTVNERCKALQESLSHDNKSVPIEHYNEVVNEMNQNLKQLNEFKLKNHELQELVDSFVSDNGDSQYLVNHLNESNDISVKSINFKILQKELIKEKNQKLSLQRQLKNFVEELECKLPQIDQYDANLRNLEDQLYESSLLIESTSGKIEFFKSENQSLKQQKSQYEHTIKTLQQQRVDLAKQVQTLIYLGVISGKQCVVSEEDCRFVKNLLNNHERLHTNDDAGIQSVISQQLVAFRNVQQLQENNENLLVALRELGEKLESLESQSNDLSDIEGETNNDREDEKVTVEQAKDAILKLESYNDSLVLKLESVTKERDILKTLCNTGSPTAKNDFFSKKDGHLNEEASNTQLADKAQFLEKQLHIVQANHQEEVARLNKDLQNYIQEKTELTINWQKEINVRELLESQYKLLSDSKLPQLEKEIDILKETITKFSNANLEKDLIHNKTMNEMLSMVQAIESLRSKNGELNDEIVALQHHIEEYKSTLKNNKDNKLYTAHDIDLLKEQIADLSLKNDENTLKLNNALLAKSEAEKKLETKEKMLLAEISVLKNKIEVTGVSTDESHINEYQTLQKDMETARKNVALLESEIESLKNENNDLQHNISSKDQEIKLVNESLNRWKINCSNVSENFKELEKTKNKEISDTEERYEDRIAKLEEELNNKSANLKLKNDEIFRELNLEIENLQQSLSTVQADAESKSKALLEREQPQATEDQLENLKKQMDEQLQERIESIKKKSREEIRQLVDKKRAELARSFEKSVETKANTTIAERISKIEEDFKTKIEDAKKKASEDAEKRSAMKIKILENKLKKMKEANNQSSSQVSGSNELARPITALSNTSFAKPSLSSPSAMSPLTPNMTAFSGFGQTNAPTNFPVSNANNFSKMPSVFHSANITSGNTTSNVFGKRPFENVSSTNKETEGSSTLQNSLFPSSTFSGAHFVSSNAPVPSSGSNASYAQENPEKRRKLSDEQHEVKEDMQNTTSNLTESAMDKKPASASEGVPEPGSTAFLSSFPATETNAKVESVVEKSGSPETFKELSPLKSFSTSQEGHTGGATANAAQGPESENSPLQNKISEEETANLNDELMPDADLNEENSITKDKELGSKSPPSTESAIAEKTGGIAESENGTAEELLPLPEYTDDAEKEPSSFARISSQGLSGSPVDSTLETQPATFNEGLSMAGEVSGARATASHDTSLQPVELTQGEQAQTADANNAYGLANGSGTEEGKEDGIDTLPAAAQEDQLGEQDFEPEQASSAAANVVLDQENATTSFASHTDETAAHLKSNDETVPLSKPIESLETLDTTRASDLHVESAHPLLSESNQFSLDTFVQQNNNAQTEFIQAQTDIEQENIFVEERASEQQTTAFSFVASEPLRAEATGTPMGEETPINEATVTTPLAGTTPITQAEEVPDALAENEQASTPDSVEEA